MRSNATSEKNESRKKNERVRIIRIPGCSWDEYEKRNGRYFIVFEKSRLLDMLSVITDCQRSLDGTAYPGEWKHYGIYCQNHIIDVISHNEPTIKKLENKTSDM